jgi:D-lactate dehydrogenase
MRVAVFDTHSYDRQALETMNLRFEHALTFLEPRLTLHMARLAAGFPAICSFVNDRVDAAILRELHQGGTRQRVARSLQP